MNPGTAKIIRNNGLFCVQYTNTGSELRCAPQWFRTEAQAREFCRAHCLTII